MVWTNMNNTMISFDFHICILHQVIIDKLFISSDVHIERIQNWIWNIIEKKNEIIPVKNDSFDLVPSKLLVYPSTNFSTFRLKCFVFD